MNNEKEKTMRFGFSQLRFIIAVILLFAASLKAYQLATVPLPPLVHGSIFTPFLEILNNRGLLMFVVETEILFALLLLSEVWRQWTWLISLFCFVAFFIVSVMKGLSGESSCGCFGIVTVNPWITALYDTIIVIILVVFREPINFDFKLSILNRKKLIIVLMLWFVLAIPVLFAMLSLKQQPHATLGTEFISFDDKPMIVLKPETWISKQFPLTTRFVQQINIEILEKGNWTVILIHNDCPKCLQLISDLERTAENIAIVEIPSGSTAVSLKTPFPYFKLDENNDWFVTTPYIVKLSDGICVSVNEP
jgi:hypothetical protein